MTNNQMAGEIKIAGRSDTTVLITGPTGAGKTRLAREIHDNSRRRNKPFVSINLASLHEGTLESELFGHEKGAFTSADQRRVGRLELANGGTVFLDEIGELTPRLQARLLDFLQTRMVTPVGGNRQTRLDVRVIAATHRTLAREVRSGGFREDLFHRLRVVSIQMPGLAERADEFDSILHACLAEVCAEHGRSILRITEDVAARFEAYSWPGNIRELRNVLEYAIFSTEGVEITSRDMPSWLGEADLVGPYINSSFEVNEIHGPAGGAPLAPSSNQDRKLLAVSEVSMTMDFNATLARFEREYLERALRRFRGRINRTAREIGMNKTTLIRRIREHGIEVENLLGSANLETNQSSGVKGC